MARGRMGLRAGVENQSQARDALEPYLHDSRKLSQLVMSHFVYIATGALRSLAAHIPSIPLTIRLVQPPYRVSSA